MQTAYLRHPDNRTVLVDIAAYQTQVRGVPREAWPVIYCPSCGRETFASGLFTPQQKYTPRFCHVQEPDDAECCPLSSRSRRYGQLNTAECDHETAQQVRTHFLAFDQLKRAYAVCWHLRGGQGKLSQQTFIKWIEVADSIGIWGYRYLPAWGIPLLLMLMDNHPTPNGKAMYFYKFKKDRSHFNEKWWQRHVRLEAHWLSNGDAIKPRPDTQSSFLLTIPFTEETVSDILQGQSFDWISPDRQTTLFAFSQKSLK
ncbi:hypothetical protein HZU77_015575 [Neisseriaceae bacterium TC5R-5]|nr:hypothetical protein [Neisseriaceae bacterium TC5R-5]